MTMWDKKFRESWVKGDPIESLHRKNIDLRLFVFYKVESLYDELFLIDHLSSTEDGPLFPSLILRTWILS